MRTILTALALTVIGITPASAALEITITEGVTGALPIAVAPFAAPAGETFDYAEVVQNDLQRSGLFKPLARSEMLESPSRMNDVNFRNWRAVGVEHLVIGQLTRDPAGGLNLRFKLLDVFRGRETMGYDIPIQNSSAPRSIAHRAADLIFEELTGIKGVFDTRIAYVTSKGGIDNRHYELVVADADGNNANWVARNEEPIMSPAWSPDGRKLAFVTYENGNSVIYVHDIIRDQKKRIVAEKGINGAPAFSPDGSSLAVVISNERNPDIYTIDLDDGSRRRLTSHWGIDTEPAWHPDGKSLIFTSDRGGQPQIYSIGLDGERPKRLTFKGRQNLRASYSPNGSKITLVNLSDAGYRIGVLDVERGATTILSKGPLDESPSFAPNGAVVIFSAEGDSGAELATVSIDGRVRQRLNQEGDVREPAWSPYFQ